MGDQKQWDWRERTELVSRYRFNGGTNSALSPYPRRSARQASKSRCR